MSEDYRVKFQALANQCFFETGHEVEVQSIPPSRYIVAPILSAKEVREQLWKRGHLPSSRKNALAGLGLVSWLMDNGFDFAPVSDKDFGILTSRIKELGT